MSGPQKEIERLLQEYERLGWRREEGRHTKLRSPHGRLVTATRSASDRRAILNLRAILRRIQRDEEAESSR